MTRRLVLATLVTVAAVLAFAEPSWAANNPTGADPAGSSEPSGGPAALSWIDVRDTRGISMWSYQLSFGNGGLGPIPNAITVIWGYLIVLTYNMYQAMVALAIWAIDWTLSFVWLDALVSPANTIGSSLSAVIDRFGIWPALMTLVAFMTFLWMIRGRWALGVYELAVSLVVATLAAGALANPVAYISGPGGVLSLSRDAGIGIAAGLARGDLTEPAAGEDPGPAVDRDAITAQLVDTFIRTPHQLINYGAVLERGPCEEAYNKALGPGGPAASGGDVRDAVGDCDDAYGKAAENPNADQLVSALLLAFGGLLLVLLAALSNFGLLYYCAIALFQAIKLIPMLLLGALPGSARNGLWRTTADLVMACVAIVANTVFLVGYLIFLQGIFGDDPRLLSQRFVFVDIMLVVGIALFLRLRGNAKEAAVNLANLLTWRPGGDRLDNSPWRSGGGTRDISRDGDEGNVVGTALRLTAVAKGLRRATKGAAAGTVTGPAAGASTADQAEGGATTATTAGQRRLPAGPGKTQRLALPAGRGPRGGGGSGGPQPGSGGSPLLGVVLPTAQVAIAAGTGGTSAVVTATGKSATGAALQGVLSRRKNGSPGVLGTKPARALPPGDGKNGGSGR